MNKTYLIGISLLLIGFVYAGASKWLTPAPEQPQRPEIPGWVVFPGEKWEKGSLQEAHIDSARFTAWVDSLQPEFGRAYGGQAPDTGGVMITQGGLVLQQWGDVHYRYQSASLGKTFTRMALQLAIDEGRIGSVDDRIHAYWTGEGELEAHKLLNKGKHRKLTFRHLVDMKGGFPVTNGFYWKDRVDDQGNFYPGIPEWAEWTGDPDYDNYAHVSPGKHRHYSSGGYWRLSQALTAIWQKDLKAVLDEKIMHKIGIPSDRWEWLSGKEVLEDQAFYPELPGYGTFVDAPFEINGANVLGGGGWVIMSASDFARLGLLISTQGMWEGEQLISAIYGNQGVGANSMDGWHIKTPNSHSTSLNEGFFSLGKVATRFADPTPEMMQEWIIKSDPPSMKDHVNNETSE